jgi:CRP-like cAMP-binding protein
MQRLESSIHLSVKKRVVNILWVHAQEQSSGRRGQVLLPFTRTELSQLCDTTKESVSRVFRELKESKLIDINGRTLSIFDPEFFHKTIGQSERTEN